MKQFKLIAYLTLIISLIGCAQVPLQSIELSQTLGNDLQTVQRSHRKAVDLLYDRQVERVNEYIEEVVIPLYAKTVIDQLGPKISQDLAKSISSDATQADKNHVYNEMRKVVLSITSRVEKRKVELLNPIESSRKLSLQELDMTYAQMQRANSVLTAHLSSVAKVHTVQDELISKAGLKDFRLKVGTAALSIDKDVESALKNAKSVEEAIEKIKAVFDNNSNQVD